MYTLENFPFRSLLLMGTAGYLLRSAALNEASNQLTYSADGVQVSDKDKAQIFTSLGSSLWEEFKQLASNIRISHNIAQVYGVKHSEYVYRAI
jgi:ABC-type lipoprotein release transport system permease subunit